MTATTSVRADRSALRLSEVARHVVIPEGIVDTLWFEVEERCREFGDTFDVWQDGLGQVTLGLREDGMFAATVGGVTWSIPRQVAKTFLVMRIVVALCTLYPNLTVLWTAHRLRTATQTFQKMKAFCTRRQVRPYLEPGRNLGTAIRDANGEQEIPFANGSRIMFGAREQGFGRGFDEVDIEVFDEAQILTIRALEDMVAATNQSRFEHGALLFYMGTPPRPADEGESFQARRDKALKVKKMAGVEDFGEPVAVGDALYVECSADANVGREGGPSLDDVEQVESANPSYPHRTPPVSVARLRENLPDDEAWRREGLGVWDEVVTGGVIPPQAWRDAADTDSVPVDRWALGVEVAPDLAWASLSIAGLRADGSWHIALEACRETHGEGVEWLPEYVSQFVALNPQIRGVVVDSTGPVKSLLERRGTGQSMRLAFVGTKVKVNAIRVSDLGASCASLLSGLSTEDIRHMGQAPLTTAALAAGKRDLADTGMWTWHRRAATSDITPIQAATLALHGAQATKLIRPGGAAGTGRRVVTG